MANLEYIALLCKGAYNGDKTDIQGTPQLHRVARAYLNDSPMFEVTKTRNSNSRNIQNHKFMVTRDEASKRFILMVNKDTGKVDKKIELIDSTPYYVVDDIDTRVFVCERNKTISCYDMK